MQLVRLHRSGALFFAGLLGSWFLATAAAGAPAHAPRIVCAAPAFDFGTVEEESVTSSHEFTIENTGDLTLEITKVFSSCGCLTGAVRPTSIPPGGRATLRARLDLRGRRGLVEKELVVHSNDPRSPELALTLRARLSPAVECVPPALYFGALKTGVPARREVEVRFRANRPDDVLRVTSDSPVFSARVETVQTGQVYRVEVEADVASLAPGEERRSRLRLITRHGPKDGIELPAMAERMGRLIVAPKELVFTPAENRVESRVLLIRPGEAESVQLLGVDLPDASMRWSAAPAPAGGLRVQIDGIRMVQALDGRAVRLRTTAQPEPVTIVFRDLSRLPEAPAAPP